MILTNLLTKQYINNTRYKMILSKGTWVEWKIIKGQHSTRHVFHFINSSVLKNYKKGRSQGKQRFLLFCCLIQYRKHFTNRGKRNINGDTRYNKQKTCQISKIIKLFFVLYQTKNDLSNQTLKTKKHGRIIASFFHHLFQFLRLVMGIFF